MSLWIVSFTVRPSDITCMSFPSMSLAASLTFMSMSTQSLRVSLTIYSACLGITLLKRFTWFVKSFIEAFMIPFCLTSSFGNIPALILIKRPSISFSFRVQLSSRLNDRPLIMPIIVLISGFGLFSYSLSSMNIWSWDSVKFYLRSTPKILCNRPTRCQIVPLTDADGLLSLISSNNLWIRTSGLIIFFTRTGE